MPTEAEFYDDADHTGPGHRRGFRAESQSERRERHQAQRKRDRERDRDRDRGGDRDRAQRTPRRGPSPAALLAWGAVGVLAVVLVKAI